MGERRVVVRGRWRRRLYTGGRDFLPKSDGSLWVLHEEVPEMCKWTPSAARGFAPGTWRTVEWEPFDYRPAWPLRVLDSVWGWFTR